jgi:Ca-activated chloride channel family protein
MLFRNLSLLAGLGLVVSACGSNDASITNGGAAMESDGLGATPGGAQDIGAAREMLDKGMMPSTHMLTYQGIFSEHDLGFVDAEPCPEGQALCIEARAGTAESTIRAGTELIRVNKQLVQVGFASGIPADFVRAPLNLSLAVDVSGSMSGSRISSVRQALNVLVDQLRDDDLFSLVTFNSQAVVLIEPTSGAEKQRLKTAIAQLEAGGGTNIGEGLEKGINQVRAHLEDATVRSARVMLFTDMHPNSGMVDGRDFVTVLRAAADEGIGVSSFGVGIDFGAEMASQISEVEGGNYFHLETPEKIAKVFDEDFKLMVTPVGYNVSIKLSAPLGYTFGSTFGMAGGTVDDCALGDCREFTVPTLFLSRGGGAIYLELVADDGVGADNPQFLCDVSYDDIDRQRQSDSSTVDLGDSVPDAEGTTPSIRKGAALINVIDGMRDLITQNTSDELAFAALRSVRTTADSIGEYGFSLYREAAFLSQAIVLRESQR